MIDIEPTRPAEPRVERRARRLPHAVIAAVALAGLAAYVFIYASGRAGLPIRSDGVSYYVYLPSWFIFGDPLLAETARDCCGGEFPEYTAIRRWPGTRRWMNPHPMGVAVMQAPLFLAAHGLTRWSNLPPDGFSLYYQHAAGLSGLLAMIAGLWVLARLLARHASAGVTAATLAAIVFGTNLFHYGTYDSGYSHAYAFALLAAFADLTERWHRAPDRRLSVLLGACAGLIVLTRHTNALFLVLFPLFGVTSRATLGDAAARLLRHRREVLIAAAVGGAVVSPQLLTYYAATGRPLVSAYMDLGFNFDSPRLFGVLFSVQKGLFFWSPLLLLGVAGLALAVRVRSSIGAFVLPSVLALSANTYLIASWWDWQFGGSYGHRGFVDAFPLLALGLAQAFTWAARRRTTAVVIGAAALAASALSVFQMLQYWNGIIPISDMTFERYREVFLQWP